MRKKIQMFGLVLTLAFCTAACGAKSEENVELGQYTGMEIEYTDTTTETKEEAVWKKVCENVKVNDYPEEDMEAAKKAIDDYYTKCAQDYGLELREFLEQTGSSEKEYEKYKKEEAKKAVKSQLTAEKIAKKENINVSDTEYEAKLEEYGSFGEDMDEEKIKQEVLLSLVKEFCVENNTVVSEK